MRIAVLSLILLPAWAGAQQFEFQLQPEAFPMEISGWQPFQPWSGGVDESTPDLVDIDGDGDLDFFCGGYSGYINLYDNAGNSVDPSFIYVSNFFDSLTHPNALSNGSDAAFADLDDDEDYDVVVGGSYVSLYSNEGSANQPQFVLQIDTLKDVGGTYIIGTHVALEDIDADGDYDLFAGHYSGYIKYYENVGTPTSHAFQLIDSNWFNTYVSTGYADPCFGDLDADGDLDLLVGTGEGTLYCYRNDGTAQNANMALVSNNYLGLDVQEDASPELADIDGDGDLDLFVGRNSEGQSATQGDVFFYENVGTSSAPDLQFVTSNYLTWDCGWAAAPRLVDIDGDGDPDLFSRIGDRLLFYRNQGTIQHPFFVFESDSFGGIQLFDLMPWFVDLDADGDYDLLAGTSAIPGPPGLHYYQNLGTPQSPNFTLMSTDLVPGVFISTESILINPWTGDIDADGDQDLFVSDYSHTYYFQNIGDSTQFQFQLISSQWQNLGLTDIWNYGCFWDMDADDDLDLFFNYISDFGQIWETNLMFYRNVGTPQNAQMILENEDLFPEFMILMAAPFLIDMDQDGDGDMFVGDIWGGIRYFKNVTGDTTGAVQPLHPAASSLRPPVLSIGPNPANPFVVASFEFRVASNMSLDVYDLLGRRVAELASGFHLPGEYRYVWDASGKAAGIYIIRLQTGRETVGEKLVVLK